MPWASLGDDFHDDPQAYRAGATALGVWAMCRSWCADKLSDGRIPKGLAEAKARALRADPEVVFADLLRSELWRDDGTHFVDVRYLEENPSRARVIEKKASAAKRYDAWKSSRVGTEKSDTNAFATPRQTRHQRRDKRVTNATYPSPISSSHSSEESQNAGAPARAETHPPASPSEGDNLSQELTTEQKRQLRDLAWARAYSEGIASTTGAPHVVSSPQHLVLLRTVATTHGKGLKGPALDAWFRDRGAAYAKARPQAQFEAGYSVPRLLDWLNAGSPTASNVHGGPAKPEPPKAPPVFRGYER